MPLRKIKTRMICFDFFDRLKTVLFIIYVNSQFIVNVEEVTHEFYSTRYRSDVSNDRPASLLVWISYVHCQIPDSRMRCRRSQCSWMTSCELKHTITQCHLSGNNDLNQYSRTHLTHARFGVVDCGISVVQSHTTVVSCCNLNEVRVPAVDLGAQLCMNRNVVTCPFSPSSFIHPAGSLSGTNVHTFR
jgi:hypothetical protein